VIVHSAGIQDRVAARAVLMRLFCRFDTLTTVFADGGYTGTLIDWAKQMFGYKVEVVKRNEQHLFRVLPKRWIVERTFAWLNWSRRLSKDYELRHSSAEAMIHIAFAHQLLRRTIWFLDRFLDAKSRIELGFPADVPGANSPPSAWF
jgi:transposase